MDAPRKKPPKLFVCLSGGGFRASLFQLGALKRLHEAGVLPHVVAVSATSGGSYVAACLALFPRGIKYDDGGKPEHWLDQWDKIEAMVLHFARNGVLRPTAILIGALVSYALAAMAAVIAYAGIVAFAPVAVGILVFGLAGHIGLFVYLRGATRLHLDQFDQHEGTALAELFLNDRTDLQQHSSYQNSPLRGVTDMLPAPSSAISDDWAFLASHMRASETLWSPLRAARRFFNI